MNGTHPKTSFILALSSVDERVFKVLPCEYCSSYAGLADKEFPYMHWESGKEAVK